MVVKASLTYHIHIHHMTVTFQRVLKQEAQGLGALLDKMEDDDHIKLDNNHNIEI